MSSPYKDIPKKIQQVLMFGTEVKGELGTGTFFEGVIPNLQRRFENTESEFVKTRLHQYMSEQPCATCNGTRLKKEVLAVRLHTLNDYADKVLPRELHTATACGTSGTAACGVTEDVQIDPTQKSVAAPLAEKTVEVDAAPKRPKARSRKGGKV